MLESGHSRFLSIPEELQASGFATPDRRPFRFFASALCRKIRDYVMYKNSKNPVFRRQSEAAYAWIMEVAPSNGNGKKLEGIEFFSFTEVCEILDYPADRMRARILQLTGKDFARKSKACENEEKQVNDDTDEL